MMRSALMLTAVGMLVAGAACGGGEEATSPTTAPPTTAAPTTVSGGQPDVVVEKGVPFATFGDITLTLDLYLPAEPSGAPIAIDPWYPDDLARAGAIVAVGGGAGVPDPDTEDYAERYLSNHGEHIRAQAEAYGCMVSFVRARVAELGNDDPFVVLSGFSEGGGITAHVALFGESLEQRWDEYAAEVGGPPRQVECTVADGSTDVDALVGGAGTYDLYVPVIEGLYGRTWMQEHDPELQQFLASAVGIDPELTVRLAHASDDHAIPMTVSTDFEGALADAGYDVQLTTYEGGHNAPPADIGLPIYTELLDL